MRKRKRNICQFSKLILLWHKIIAMGQSVIKHKELLYKISRNLRREWFSHRNKMIEKLVFYYLIIISRDIWKYEENHLFLFIASLYFTIGWSFVCRFNAFNCNSDYECLFEWVRWVFFKFQPCIFLTDHNQPRLILFCVSSFLVSFQLNFVEYRLGSDR